MNSVNSSANITRKQLADDARMAALEDRWDEAIEINLQLLERAPKDADARNRLGRAYLALGRIPEAVEAYKSSLHADPANLIARRNLDRLDLLRRKAFTPPTTTATPAVNSMQRTAVFIEEVGKTWVDELVNAVDMPTLASVFSGEKLLTKEEQGRLVVCREDGSRLGEIEAKTAERMMNLMRRGVRYEVYALGRSGQSLRVILREVQRDPAVTDVSFPRQITSRSYLREREYLRSRDESDFFMSDDDEDEDDMSGVDDEDDSSGDDTDSDTEDLVIVPDDDDSGI